jgi:hypothetical protein
LVKEDKAAKQLVKDYEKLLFKREKYRMETYGFEWTKTGWINIDNGTIPKTWGEQPLEVTITNGKQFDRVYTYVIYASIKSLYRLNSDNNELFYVGNNEDKSMLMPKKELGIIVSIGYKNETPWLGIKEFETGSEPKMSLNLSVSTANDVKRAIAKYEKYKTENRISEDLKYMAEFFKMEQKNKIQQSENTFLKELLFCIEPCCWKSELLSK